MSFSFKSVKDFFVKTRKSQISEHDKTKQSLLIEIEWEKIQEAAKEGFGFFLGYAKRHFDESKYKEILLNINEIGRFIEKENTFCLLNHSNTEIIFKKELLNDLYLVAKTILLQRRFRQAQHLFYILSVFCPKNFDVQMGLGLTYQYLKQPSDAIVSFAEAKALNPLSPFLYLYTAESYLELKEWDLAKKNSQEGLKLVKKDQIHLFKALDAIDTLCKKHIEKKAA